jgi:ATPase subunit of ABC transporter with duplicated ATPase domains
MGLIESVPNTAELVDAGGNVVYNERYSTALKEMGASEKTIQRFYASPKVVQERFIARWVAYKARKEKLASDPKALERVQKAEAKRNRKREKRAREQGRDSR